MMPHTMLYMQMSCNTTRAPQRCPRVELYNVDSGRLINGFGGNGSHATWGEEYGMEEISTMIVTVR